MAVLLFFFFFQAEDGIRDIGVTGVQTCALPISGGPPMSTPPGFSPEQLEDRGAGWTAREIAQQPAVWKETGRTVGSHREDANAFLQPLLGLPDLRIVLTGAGTSAFVGEILAPALSLRLGRRVDAVAT